MTRIIIPGRKSQNVAVQMMRLIGKLILSASYAVIGTLAMVAFLLAVTSWLLGSSDGLYSFTVALSMLAIGLVVAINKRSRQKLVYSEDGELHMLMFSVIVGNFIGLVGCTAVLLAGASTFAFPLMMLCSVIIPFTAMFLEHAGLIDAFDGYELYDE